ncbi:cytochrome o ubiquinol oxidase subunit III [Pseudomonas aeruginosa]|nr:cytochrome o ubiquinol oxidase subunit III [Pseudomonas aeruginosa]
MSTAVLNKHLADAHEVGHDHDHAHDSGGNTVFGFWLYLMTDCVLFASVFATYAVLVHHTAGGPSGKDIFELPYVLVETAILLVSSCTYGLAMLSAHKGAKGQAIAWLGVTFLLGAAFIGMEINEFHHLIAEGFGPSRSGLPVVLLHPGRHARPARQRRSAVDAGADWRRSGPAASRAQEQHRRMMCLSLFWHFLDIVWICVFTVVYLMGGPVMSSAAHDNHGAGHGSLGSYAIGFVLSVILTAIPFYMVMDGGFSRHATILTMVVLGLVQVVVHLICFLHMNMSSEGRWNVMAFIFTVIVILLVVGLSLWIIFSADMLMMPMP